MKNCLECSRAKDQGETLKCGFNPKPLLAMFPYYPAVLVKVSAMPISKDKIPAKDCPAFKPKKGSA